MRRFRALFLAVFVGGALFAAMPAGADHTPSEACGAEPVVVGESSVTVCVADLGAATASMEDDGGYVVADGDEGNALTAISPCLDGYAGVQVVGEDASVVASGDGSYHYPGDASDVDPEEALAECAGDAPEPPDVPEP